MASVKLYLKEPNSQKRTLIYLIVHINGKRLKISSNEFVNPKFWNPEKEIVTRGINNSMEINHALKSMKDELSSIIRRKITLKQKLDILDIRDEFNITFDRKKRISSDFFECYNQFIEHQNVLVSPGSIKNYKSTLKRLKEFAENHRFNLTFDNITDKFYIKFLKYLYNDIGVLNNTAGKHIKILKTFMNYATKIGVNENTEYLNFKRPTDEVNNIYLTEDEINSLIELDLSGNIENEKLRNQFIFQCYTGMRFSDIMNFKPENIQGNEIYVRTLKTREDIKIVITKPIKRILNKVIKLGFKQISNQKLNKHLKELGKKAGIDDSTLQVRYRGNTRIEKTVPKYELITTHTARRTFITIADKNGVRASVIKRITGIRNDRTLQKYIKLTDKDIEDEMKKMWR